MRDIDDADDDKAQYRAAAFLRKACFTDKGYVSDGKGQDIPGEG